MLKPLSIDEKGQAYSAFKLLIAAIIAMAILGILVPIIMQVMGLITNNPTDKAVSLLSELVDKPSTLKRATDVSFDSANPTLSGVTLAEKTAVSAKQICMDLGDFDTGDGTGEGFKLLTSDNEHIITYTGTGKVVDLAIICHITVGDLVPLVDSYGVLTSGDTFGTNCKALCPPSGDCCAVIMER